ncbi:hypothetical protein C1645_735084 [Glomus cerebriforme]|uniref:Uncharacterized protein n=1 Tax=Glomus cerebriforme TaxID=658196 RepID=A0A397T720_9GLOM|nr:hypothetical protein C1645_735084 [Glomus cerebriforme]
MNHLEYNGCYNILNVLDDIPEFLYATNQVNKTYADERLIPIGKWGGELGKLALELFIIIFRKLIPSNRIGISEEEHKMMIIQYEKEVEYYRSYFISLRIFCQKA